MQDSNQVLIKKPIYRFKLSDTINEELSRFSKNHQYDHRKDFKEAFLKWREEKDELFKFEIEMHKSNGYQGDIEDKIFKSARYYFRKKQESSTEKKTPTTTNHYITVNKELLETMDSYIQKHIQDKPANSFIKFCNENKEIIKKEIVFLYDIQNIKTAKEIREKIKKTYKNRYYKFYKEE
jgi:hypothetical protein